VIGAVLTDYIYNNIIYSHLQQQSSIIVKLLLTMHKKADHVTFRTETSDRQAIV